MAVNENLYSWMLKTYGMGAAEWYRNNPTSKPGANPYLPKGAYVPQAKAPQQTGPRGETLASVSPDIVEASVIEPAPKPAETEDQKFERFYNQSQQQLGSLTPAQKTNVNNLLTYDPEYGEYGGYITKENLGFSPTSVLYKRYEDAIQNIPLRYQNDPLQVGHRALYGTSVGQGSDAGYQMVLANEADRQARAKAFEDIYKTPLSQLPYTSYSAAKQAGLSLDDYRASLAKLNIDIPTLQGEGGYFVRAATAEDPEVQQYGIYNVGRSDYMQNRRNEAIQKNIQILQQQANDGNQSSEAFLNSYVQEAPQKAENATPEVGPRGEEAFKERGPRGEKMGDVAWNTPAIPQGPYTPVRNFGSRDKPFYGPSTKDTHNNPSGERVIQMRYEAEAPSFDEQKALIARQAADEYRRRGQVEDPFRSGSFG
jgi:hypothetical protein